MYDDENRRRLRAQLFEDLRKGHRDGKAFHPDEAERVAAELGLDPLNPLPDTSQFDPRRLSHWSVCMAIAWIGWRNLDRVREIDNEYRRQRKVWIFRDAPPRKRILREPGHARRIVEVKSDKSGGWGLEDQQNVSLSLLRIIATHPDARPTVCSVSEAQETLWTAASAGWITAEAIRAADNSVVEIPSREWRFLKAREDATLRAGPHLLPVELSMEPGSANSMYGAVAFPRTTLLALWPAEGATPGSKSHQTDGLLAPDMLTAARWPIGCVVAWRYAQMFGTSSEARDDLVRAAAVRGQHALDCSHPHWVERLHAVCRDILDRAASDPGTFSLRDRAGNIVRFGTSAQLHGDNKTFALCFDMARDVDDRVDGLWCLAAEVRAAWSDDAMQINVAAPSPTLHPNDAAQAELAHVSDTAPTLHRDPGPESLKAAIRNADKTLFPNGPPAGLLVKQHRRAIEKHLGRKISDTTFQRHGIGKLRKLSGPD
jgi:hypothetical protein